MHRQTMAHFRKQTTRTISQLHRFQFAHVALLRICTNGWFCAFCARCSSVQMRQPFNSRQGKIWGVLGLISPPQTVTSHVKETALEGSKQTCWVLCARYALVTPALRHPNFQSPCFYLSALGHQITYADALFGFKDSDIVIFKKSTICANAHTAQIFSIFFIFV